MVRLMQKIRLSPASLRGPARRAASHHAMPTMRGRLADPVAYFSKALRTELEHGRAGGQRTNVTNNTLSKTAKIALAHLRGVEYGEESSAWVQFPAYYDYLWWMEKSGPVGRVKNSARRTRAGSVCR